MPVTYILARLRDRDTVTDVAVGIVAAIMLPRPWGMMALAAVVARGLIPDARPAGERK